MIDPAEIAPGRTFETSVAVWTVDTITPSGFVYVIRDDGRAARFGLNSFAGMVVRRLPDKPSADTSDDVNAV